MHLQDNCTQAEFGQLVGISQPAVSDLISREVLRPGESAQVWLLAYCGHLREQAAGRGADGALAAARTELAKTHQQLLDIKLKVSQKEFAPVYIIEQVLAIVGRNIVGALEPLHMNIQKLCPDLNAESIKLIQSEISRVCEMAINASMQTLEIEDEAEQQPAVDPEEEALSSTNILES